MTRLDRKERLDRLQKEAGDKRSAKGAKLDDQAGEGNSRPSRRGRVRGGGRGDKLYQGSGATGRLDAIPCSWGLRLVSQAWPDAGVRPAARLCRGPCDRLGGSCSRASRPGQTPRSHYYPARQWAARGAPWQPGRGDAICDGSVSSGVWDRSVSRRGGGPAPHRALAPACTARPPPAAAGRVCLATRGRAAVAPVAALARAAREPAGGGGEEVLLVVRGRAWRARRSGALARRGCPAPPRAALAPQPPMGSHRPGPTGTAGASGQCQRRGRHVPVPRSSAQLRAPRAANGRQPPMNSGTGTCARTGAGLGTGAPRACPGLKQPAGR